MEKIIDLTMRYLKGEFKSYTATPEFIDFVATIKIPFALPFPIKITKEVARYIVDNYNDINRKHTESTSSSYAKQMKNGEWQLNGEPLIFVNDKKLGDGQHRMFGCIKSETSNDFMLICGVERNNMTTMDSGKNRSNSDCLSLLNKDLNKNSLLASIIVCAINNLKGHFSEHGSPQTRPTAPTKNEVVKFFNEHKELCSTIFTFATTWKKKLPKSGHILTPREMGGFALYFIIKGCNYSKVTSFFNHFVDGTYGNTVLMKSVYDKLDGTESKEMPLRAQYLIKGWNYYANEDFDKHIKNTKDIPSLIVK